MIGDIWNYVYKVCFIIILKLIYKPTFNDPGNSLIVCHRIYMLMVTNRAGKYYLIIVVTRNSNVRENNNYTKES